MSSAGANVQVRRPPMRPMCGPWGGPHPALKNGSTRASKAAGASSAM